MTEKQLSTISNALTTACNYLYDNLDVICDEDYYKETLSVLKEIEYAKEVLKNIYINDCTSS